MASPTIDALRAHVGWQLDLQLPRAASKRLASIVLALLDEEGYLDVASIVEVAFEELDAHLAKEPTSAAAARFTGLTLMAAGERDDASGALERLLGEDLSHELRGEVGEAVTRLDRLLQHVGLLHRDLLDNARESASARALAIRLGGDGEALLGAATAAVRAGMGVRSASRIVAFFDRPAPDFSADESVLGDVLRAAVSAWREGRFLEAKRLLDRALGRDVLHDERDVVVRLLGAMRSRVLSASAWAREARRELVLVTLGALASVPTAEVRAVLELVLRCDPIGVGARDRAEAMRVRAQWDGAERFVAELGDRALEELEGVVDFPALSARFALTVDELKRARHEFRVLGQTPLERLVLGVDDYASELVFAREGPALVMHPGMRGAVEAEPTDELAAVGRVLLDRNAEFLRYGMMKLEPIPVDEVARATDLTVDQVRRVLEGVRIATPWGTVAATHFVRREARE